MVYNHVTGLHKSLPIVTGCSELLWGIHKQADTRDYFSVVCLTLSVPQSLCKPVSTILNNTGYIHCACSIQYVASTEEKPMGTNGGFSKLYTNIVFLWTLLFKTQLKSQWSISVCWCCKCKSTCSSTRCFLDMQKELLAVVFRWCVSQSGMVLAFGLHVSCIIFFSQRLQTTLFTEK